MLQRHRQILTMVINNEPIGIVRISNETGYPHHKVRYSLRILEEENVIEPTSQGATTTDKTAEFVENLNEAITDTTAQLKAMKSTINDNIALNS